MNNRPLTRPTSTSCSRRSGSSASRAPSGCARSNPRSRAKWLSVPMGTITRGNSRSTATPATAAADPSPPATASDSAPPSTAARAASLASCPGSSTRTRIPRSRVASVRLPRKAAALPAAGLTIKWAEKPKTPSRSDKFTLRTQLLCSCPAWCFRRMSSHALFCNAQSLLVQLGFLCHVPDLGDKNRPENQQGDRRRDGLLPEDPYACLYPGPVCLGLYLYV